ncbi:protein unc-45 homolog A [Olea europaea var. sylvestris]|uniref:protein unc-45 homolog A n=1 Tax=Olea europaea var. sylvestris TaxID=158386 RepID=UPI000C1CF87B|nr:protein unc-45 homolog A [Olea europaea var. sylvestris]XP_022863236.1 protein unc-45 homolog A [Olea europaea var. sylvestris]XP_022863237.1 protein unc-45 homolog A [Olea europaea var. sylvestris]
MASGSPTVNKIERAHQMYREGKYEEALDFYTEALSMAKIKPQRVALHSNRAACYLKLHDFKKASEECTSVLELDHKHTGALMLRAQTLVTLKEYHSALFDVNRLIELNPSSEVYKNLQARLKSQLSLAPIPEDEAELEEDDELVENKEEEHGEKEIEVGESQEKDVMESGGASQQRAACESAIPTEEAITSKIQSMQKPSDQQSGWQAIPKPKGHSQLDYSRWDRVEDDSSDEEDDDPDEEESLPQYRFRVRTVGVRAVK